jgi:hypothetical protein
VVQLNCSVLWVITQDRWFITNISGLPTGPIFKVEVSKKDIWPLMMGPIGSPETLVLNQPMLCNNLEHVRIYVQSNPIRSGSLKVVDLGCCFVSLRFS